MADRLQTMAHHYTLLLVNCVPREEQSAVIISADSRNSLFNICLRNTKNVCCLVVPVNVPQLVEWLYLRLSDCLYSVSCK